MTIEEARAAFEAATAAAYPVYVAARTAAEQAYNGEVVNINSNYLADLATGQDRAYAAKNWSVALANSRDRLGVALQAAFDEYRKATQPAADALGQAYAQQIDLKQQEGTTAPQVQGGQPPPLHDPFGGPG